MAALATAQDVTTALGRELTGAESAAVEGLLLEATDLVVGYLHPSSVPTPTPDPITRVVASMVAAVLTRPKSIPHNATQLTADVFSASFESGTTSPGPYLTGAMKLRLNPFRDGMVSQELSSERF
ncbi:head-to-tail adaptor [Mycobacterium phage OmniCritical]|uniref:Head-to-tail adaptor n=3 Tax=Fionnbharthvirus fionnbharth TaxID=2955891 RepID=A0A1J0MDW8_9CAUD|nr:head-tail adaptor Ad1 [Mycobacterium phage Fionnbharth]APD19230.1 head-to-tail adaptor [Mycobacterium phage Mitti]ASR87723.1 head-to-tail adaptor [Mycobacterium phage Wintermute]AVR77332.1 head-to-tail adaptor [Mycobacterium phage SamScheppers]QJD52311.1 head-to-tail adaptor [Mycobacterium phage JF1]UUG69706.1 head-to-tail adaptor [Mycobacterium phage OmniCritical]